MNNTPIRLKSPRRKIEGAWRILPPEKRKQFFGLLVLTLLGTLLETMGIGLIVPTIGLMSEGNIGNKYPALRPMLEAMGHPSHSQLVIYGVLLLLVVFVVKALYLALLSLIQARYIYDIKAHLSETLFRKYVLSPYEFHLQKNSSYLIRNLNGEAQEFVTNVLSPVVLLMTEVTLFFALASLLLYFEPVGAAVLFVATGVAIYLFQLYTKRSVDRWGRERQLHEGAKLKTAQEALSGVKEFMLLGCEDKVIGAFGVHNTKASRVQGKQSALSNIPRLWLETVGIMGLAILVIIAIQNSNTPSEAIPTIAVFAAAAFRILPSANRILGAIQRLRYASVVIDLMVRELSSDEAETVTRESPVTFNNVINLCSVSYAYPNTATQALSDISMTINKGESIGLIGASGGGKSTLVDVILGLLPPSSGGIFVDGMDIRDGMRGWTLQIGYVQQHIFLVDDTLRCNIALGKKEQDIDDALVSKAIIAAQLDSFVNTLPSGLNTIVGERGVRLSRGQRQRIGIARALYNNPPILVFDEATSALDGDTEIEVMDAIKSLKGSITMIIIAHRLSTVAHCDRVFRMTNGRLSETQL